MSTFYHIRTFDSEFATTQGTSGYSKDNVLEVYTEAALGAYVKGIRTRPSTVFSTQSQELFYLDGTGNRYNMPVYPTIASGDIYKISTTAGYIYWSTYGDSPVRFVGFNALNWAAKGWSNPDSLYSTWLTEICTKFNTLRAATENSHGNNYNVYVFKYLWTDSPDVGNSRIYFPIFTKGNDPAYQTLITI